MTPGRVDRDAIRRHLLAIDECLQILRNHQGGTLEELAKDREEQWVVERGLQLCAQNALDIATHLAAGAGHDVRDYGSALDELVRLGVLPQEFASRFRGIAGFRNVLVHGYLGVDLELMHGLLNRRLEDFTEFARSVSAWLESQPDR